VHIVSIALGGCLRGEPVSYGITEDTGGHIAYILGEMRALAARSDISRAEIVTRRFDEPHLGAVHDVPSETIAPKLTITRIDSGNPRYLAKEELAADRAAFAAALIAELRERPSLPDLIHAHFADAADVAARIERALGIPYIYTAHSLALDKRAAIPADCPVLEARIGEEDRAIAGAAAIIGSSRDECERQLLGYPSARVDRIHRIVPGVSKADRDDALIEHARTLVAPFLRDPEKPVVLAIARPVHKKNLCRLVEAFGENAALRQRANLVILAGQRAASDRGEGEQVAVISGLLAVIDRHDLYGTVAYPKAHDCGHVAGLYQLAAKTGGVFVNPALIEPYGLTIVEAAANGLPVVATKVGGPLDTVGELEHGTLIDPCNTEEIAGAINDLIEDGAKWRRCAENGKRRSAAYSWAGYADQFMRLARRLRSVDAPCSARTGPAVTSLFVSDLDNTLTGCRDGVERLHRFLGERRDFAFVIATGRSIVEARRVHREWDLPEPAAWITSTGSEIYWTTSDGLWRDPSYPASAAEDWEPQRIETAIGLIAGITPQPEYEQRDFKRSYFYDRTDRVDAVRAAIGREGMAARVVASHCRFLDILPTGAGKASAMRHVAAGLRIPDGKVFAAGDSGNDEDMLNACDNAIMVSNHSPEIAALSFRPNIYLAQACHAGGVVEGLTMHIEKGASRAPDTQTRKRA